MKKIQEKTATELPVAYDGFKQSLLALMAKKIWLEMFENEVKSDNTTTANKGSNISTTAGNQVNFNNGKGPNGGRQRKRWFCKQCQSDRCSHYDPKIAKKAKQRWQNKPNPNNGYDNGYQRQQQQQHYQNDDYTPNRGGYRGRGGRGRGNGKFRGRGRGRGRGKGGYQNTGNRRGGRGGRGRGRGGRGRGNRRNDRNRDRNYNNQENGTRDSVENPTPNSDVKQDNGTSNKSNDNTSNGGNVGYTTSIYPIDDNIMEE